MSQYRAGDENGPHLPDTDRVLVFPEEYLFVPPSMSLDVPRRPVCLWRCEHRLLLKSSQYNYSVVERAEANWIKSESAFKNIYGMPGINDGYLRRAVMDYVKDKGTSAASAAEINSLAELKAVIHWYSKADDMKSLVAGTHAHNLVRDAVEYSLKQWGRELNDLMEKQKNGVQFLSDSEDSDSDYTVEEAIDELFMDIVAAETYLDSYVEEEISDSKIQEEQTIDEPKDDKEKQIIVKSKDEQDEQTDLKALPRFLRVLLLSFQMRIVGNPEVQEKSIPTNKFGENALHIAARVGNGTVVEILAQVLSRVDKDIAANENKFGQTPAQLVATCSKRHQASVGVLAKRKSDVTLEDKLSAPVSSKAIKYGDESDVHNPKNQPVKLKYQDGLYSVILEYILKNADPKTMTRLIGLHLVRLDKISADARLNDWKIPRMATKGMSKLHQAVNRDDVEEVINLVMSRDECVDSTDGNGETPLHWACAGGSAEMVNALLDLGADRNARTPLSITPLEMACICNNYSAALSLLERGADSRTRDYKGFTLLHIVAENGWVSLFKLLMKRLKPDVNAEDNDGSTPLHSACNKGATPIVKELVKSGAICSVADAHGCTPLHYSATSGKPEIVQILLEKSKTLNIPDNRKRIPMHRAAESGNCDVVSMLIKNGSLANLDDSLGWTPLHYAAFNNHTDVAELILTEGVDPNAQTKHCLKDRIFLVQGQCSGDPIWIYVCVCKHKISLFLQKVKTNAKINVCDYGQIFLAGHGQKPPRDLMERVTNADFVHDVSDETSMHLACKKGNKAVVKMLLKKEAVDPRVRDAEGFYPLHIAAIYGNLRIFDALRPYYNETEVSLALYLAHINSHDYFEVVKEKKTDLDKIQHVAYTVLTKIMEEMASALTISAAQMRTTETLTSQLTFGGFNVHSSRSLVVAC